MPAPDDTQPQITAADLERVQEQLARSRQSLRRTVSFVLILFAGVVGIAASRFVPTREYYPFVAHSVDLLVDEAGARVVTQDSPEYKNALLNAFVTKSDSGVIQAKVIYERSVPRLRGRPFDPSHNQPSDRERERAGPEFQVRIKLSTSQRTDSKTIIRQWPTTATGDELSKLFQIEPLDPSIPPKVFPALAAHFDSAFSIPELTQAIKNGGVQGPSLRNNTLLILFITSLAAVGIGVIGLLRLRKPRPRPNTETSTTSD